MWENEVYREALRFCLPCPFQPWLYFLAIPRLLQSLTADSVQVWFHKHLTASYYLSISTFTQVPICVPFKYGSPTFHSSLWYYWLLLLLVSKRGKNNVEVWIKEHVFLFFCEFVYFACINLHGSLAFLNFSDCGPSSNSKYLLSCFRLVRYDIVRRRYPVSSWFPRFMFSGKKQWEKKKPFFMMEFKF